MRRFDVNCILGPWPTGGPTLGDAASMLAAMDKLGIEQAMVRHTAAMFYDAADANEQLSAACAADPRLVPVWTATTVGTREVGDLTSWLEALDESNVRAVALYPLLHGYPLVEWTMGGVIAALCERRMLLLLEAGQIQWNDLYSLLASHPTLNVVILETGYRILRPLYALLDRFEGVSVDLSALSSFGAIEEICQRFGVQRLLFGTGAPRQDAGGALAALAYADLDPAKLEAIAYGNLSRLLGEVRT